MRLIRYGILLTVFFSAANATAQQLRSVDLERAVLQSAKGKEVFAGYTARFEERKKAFDALKALIDNAWRELEQQKDVLSAAARTARQRQIDEMVKEVNRSIHDDDTARAFFLEELLLPIRKVAEEETKKLAAEKGYQIVFNGLDIILEPTNPSTDITDELIQRMNAAPKPGAIDPRALEVN